MRADKQASDEGFHVRYVGGNALWVDGVVLLSASGFALAIGCWITAAGISAAAVSRAMVWLALPWFSALYFLSRKLRKLAEGGFEIVLNFGAAPAYASSLIVIVALVYQFANKLW
ncbi:MAG TPA: hypothetical protein VFW56_06005 [Bradyrhizobium sp.]|jgi:hypothetical protein|nr:hypothetical protein [Bradyrhizobium sp.]